MSDRVEMKRRMARVRGGAARLALVAGWACVLGLAGCGRDESEQALSDASIKLAALDVGVGTRMPEGVSSSTYTEVVQSMQPIASGEGALAADAAVLLSNAQRGLGIHAAAHAADLEKQALNMMPGIRARLRAWQMHNAAAEASQAYDPAPELARLDADVRARQEEAERVRAAKGQVEERIAGLLNQVADRLTQASALRDQAGALQLQIPAVSATEGLALAEQIRELSRQADKLEFEARNLKNQADSLALDVAGAEVEITKLTTQGELFGQSRAAVQARAQAAQEGAARARGDAEQAAVEIAERVDTGQNALTPFREQQVAPAAEQAMSQFETAANSAKLGTSARRSNAQLALGQAQQSLGDAHWTRALGLDTYAQLMGELAAAEPPLPSAAEYASRAEQARTQANEARQAAYDAYQAAKAAYESTGASGESGALLDQVSVRLNEISRAVGKGVVSDEALSSLEDPESAEADSEDESMDEEQDASQAADAPAGDPAEEIRTLISELAAATESGSYAQVGDVIHPASDADAPIVEQLGDTLAAAERLDQVTADAFGESFTAWAASSAEAQAGQAMSPTAMFDLDPEALDIRVEGDEAMALTGGPGSPELRFRRIDGEWKLLFSAQDMGGGADAMPEAMRQAMAELVPEILTASTKAYTVAAEGVESGSLESNQAVFVTIQSELRSLSQKIMQVMMEAGGGGG